MDREVQTLKKPAVCCACAQQCGLLVHVAGGRITAITGDAAHPSSAGFVCPKGTHAHELHYDASRIHSPQKRIGPRGGGRWQTISWDQALDEIAAQIRALAARHGPETLAYGFGTLHGADAGIGERFLNLFGSPNSVGQDKICYAPIGLGEALTYGFGPTFFTYPVPGKTRCMVIWGMRPSASTPLLWRQILKARRAGAKLIVIDPERTREARKADLWLQNCPGTDSALALSLIHCVVEEGLHDRGFVAEHTIGFADLVARAADYAPARIAATVRLPAEQISAAARLLATHGPAIIHAGNGLCQSGRSSVQSGRALACLIAVTGNLGRAGAHVLAGPPCDLKANGDAADIDALSAEQRAKRLGAETYPYLGKGFQALDAVMSPAWYGRRNIMTWMGTAHEPTLWRAITERTPYPVTALILQHHNPVGGSPNTLGAAAALAHPNLELFVAQDLFLNATSRLADYVLPAAHWLEKPFYSAGYGYVGFSGDYAEAKAAPIPPEHAHRSDYDLWRDLGQRLGQASLWPATAEGFWDSCLEPAGLDFATLCERLGPATGAAVRKNRSTAEDAGRAPRYGTASGKIELRSGMLADWGLDPLPGFEWPALFAAAGQDYPLVLTTGGRKLEGFHQHAPQQAAYCRKYPHPVVSMHPETAAAAGIAADTWVSIETPLGRIRQRARLTADLAPGIVHADRWWYPDRAADARDPYGVAGTNINVCTDGAPGNCDPVFGAWLLRGLPCRVVASESPDSMTL